MANKFTTIDLRTIGAKIIEPFSVYDSRGKMVKYYENQDFSCKGYDFTLSEMMIIDSEKDVLRGIHFQRENAQTKLIYCVMGRIWGVVVDLRKDSKTFGTVDTIELTEDSKRGVLVPAGCGFGSYAIESSKIILCCAGDYVPGGDSGIIWDDDELNVPWPVSNIQELIISDKDRKWGTFRKYKEES